ncbi:MAG: HAMP domain-containing histidine kinase [Lachnospiraceae bacterium]|nr:HAMP domain-containing histidine kinase [Lachnospiraceae bacterium]
MKKHLFLFCMSLTFLLEGAAAFLFFREKDSGAQDVVAVNRVVKTLERDWNHLDKHKNATELDYAVLDSEGNLLWKTREDLSESMNAAIAHRDTILDLSQEGNTLGKVLIYNNSEDVFTERRRAAVTGIGVLSLIQILLFGSYGFLLYRKMVLPFHKLEGFAERIAGGNLDVPLEMDRQNLFGVFTESFDLMRAELKRARLAEAEANAEKKELVAKLSHDIKTPVASIKAAAEVGSALAEDKKIRENYQQIIQKADQINRLVTNLFTATLEELQELPVQPIDMESSELQNLLENADYLCRAEKVHVPSCLIWADRLRLQQVFDNIFANSYKYADTAIEVQAERTSSQILIVIEDFGGGVPKEELFHLKEKFFRGNNAKEVEGAGLGLFISDHFMKRMDGAFLVENGTKGLRVTVAVSLSGRI